MTEGSSRGRPGKRARVLLISLAALVGLVVVALVLPVPFVKLAPGPTFNIIGENDGKPVLTITGTQTFPGTGNLDMTTVLESGGPRGGLTFIDAIASWFDSADAVVPRELIYPDDVTGDQVKARQTGLFSLSESDAIGAALNYLGRPAKTRIIVSSVTRDSPAFDRLQIGDAIISVDGKPVEKASQVVDAVRAQPIGTTFSVVVSRNVDGEAKEQTVEVTSAENPDAAGKPYLGVQVGPLYLPDFTVDFALQDVGGPSAGLMFALGLIDRLTPGDLAQGRHIAGTGTIDPAGEVGAIGGIRQKLAGARGAGAELFLMPKVHCAEAEGHVPDGLAVAAVDTLTEAVQAIEGWTAGRAPAGCPATPA